MNSKQIPISLNYHASGIKVEDDATWVGLGWDLTVGGTIIQEVRGIRDDHESIMLGVSEIQYNAFLDRQNAGGSDGAYKYFNQRGRGMYNIRSYSESCTIWPGDEPSNSEPSTLVDRLILGHGAPDIYHYNFAGYSGKFYINPNTHQIVMLDASTDIKFEKYTVSTLAPSPEETESSPAFAAITLDGMKYFFEAVEEAYESGVNNTSPKSGFTYKLSKIDLATGKNIVFEYTDAHTTNTKYSQNVILRSCASFPPPAGELPISVSSISDVKILSRITTPTTIINFITESREDINLFAGDNLSRLKSIEIVSRSNNKKIKSFEFVYSYFPYNLTGVPRTSGGQILPDIASSLETWGKRLKLDRLQEVNYDHAELPVILSPAYTFGYDVSQIMPLKCSYARDIYGYYNGENNTKLIPNLEYFDYARMHVDDNEVWDYAGANRYADANYTGAYTLNKITYPTGGYTVFEYEPHTFTNQFIPNKQQEQTAHKIDQVEDRNLQNDYVKKQFQISKDVWLNLENKIYDGFNPYGYATATYGQMSGSAIELFKVELGTNGYPVASTSIKRWDLTTVTSAEFSAAHGKTWNEKIKLTFDSNPNVYYWLITSLPSNLVNNLVGSISVKSRITYYDDIGLNTSVSVQGGIRIKSVKNFESSGVFLSHKSYNYFDGKLLNRFDPITKRKVWCFPDNLCGDSNVGSSVPFEFSLSSELLRGRSRIGYGQVEEIILKNDSSSDIGKQSYRYINFENLASPDFHVVENIKNGLILNTYIYDSTDNLLVEKTYSYKDLVAPYTPFYSVSILQNYRTLSWDPNEISYGTPSSRSKYSYFCTPLKKEQNVLDKVTTKHYMLDTLKVVEQYAYNVLGLDTSILSTDSRGKTIELKKLFAADDQSGSAQATSLLEKMHNDYVIDERKLVNGVEVAKVHYDYKFYQNQVTIDKISSSFNQQPPEVDITFDKYRYKNILQYTEKGIVHTLLRAYNDAHVVAHIIGVDYETVNTYITQNQLDQAAADGDSTLRAVLSTLRSNIPGAIVTSYTFKPLVGMTSQTDPNNVTTFYTYDPAGRLLLVKDNFGNILQRTQYHYKGQE